MCVVLIFVLRLFVIEFLSAIFWRCWGNASQPDYWRRTSIAMQFKKYSGCPVSITNRLFSFVTILYMFVNRQILFEVLLLNSNLCMDLGRTSLHLSKVFCFRNDLCMCRLASHDLSIESNMNVYRDKAMRHASATKIQSVFRGQRARRVNAQRSGHAAGKAPAGPDTEVRTLGTWNVWKYFLFECSSLHVGRMYMRI